MSLSEQLLRHEKELTKLFNAFEEYIIHGMSHRDILGELLEKHGFDLNDSIGVVDIIRGFCKKYDVSVHWNAHGFLYLQKGR